MSKLKEVDILNSIVNWIMNSLIGQTQRVKLGRDCLSEWGSIPSGVPPGTKLGLGLFLFMIHDLSTHSVLWKYVDDITLSKVLKKGLGSFAQRAVDHISQ